MRSSVIKLTSRSSLEVLTACFPLFIEIYNGHPQITVQKV